MAIEHPSNPCDRLRQFGDIGHIARIDVVANADAKFSIQEVTHTDLSQVVTALLVVTPLGQRITLIGRHRSNSGFAGQEMASHSHTNLSLLSLSATRAAYVSG